MKSSILLARPGSASAWSPALGAGAQRRGNAPIRFQAMDVNGDARHHARRNGAATIARSATTTGTATASSRATKSASARAATTGGTTATSRASIDHEDDWTDERFRDARSQPRRPPVAREWHADAASCSRASTATATTSSAGPSSPAKPIDDDREDRFADLDDNNDGRLTRDEWHGSAAVFDALDANRDGVLTRAEAVGTEGDARDEFRSVDVNGDGSIARTEWHWNVAAFDRLDANRDGRLSRQEFEDNTAATACRSRAPAYRAGYERGRSEGIQAGRKTRPRECGTSKASASSRPPTPATRPSMGNRADYQAGYRVGFRRGYREGFRTALNR